METLHKRSNGIGAGGLESKEGEQERLCSNSADVCSPSLDFNTNDECVSKDDEALDYLAQILVQAYFDYKHAQQANNNQAQ